MTCGCKKKKKGSGVYLKGATWKGYATSKRGSGMKRRQRKRKKGRGVSMGGSGVSFRGSGVVFSGGGVSMKSSIHRRAGRKVVI
jgi:hypothetical protein